MKQITTADGNDDHFFSHKPICKSYINTSNKESDLLDFLDDVDP
jgi:hypothetical protein